MTFKHAILVSAFAASLWACEREHVAENASPPPPQPVDETVEETSDWPRTDYAELDHWLCHPSKDADACDVDLTTSAVAGDGSVAVEEFEAADDPAIDCFYIYPTISFDLTANSDLKPGAEELNIVKQQFARFGSECRMFAPMYRQATLPEMQRFMTTGVLKTDTKMRFADVNDAWAHYLETENKGRGVVLIGHSQGADMIRQLLETRINNSDEKNLIVSAIAAGFNLHINNETNTAAGLPLCETGDQTGCVIGYSSFRAETPPPPTGWFGVMMATGERAACVNPAALSGDNGVLDARMPVSSFGAFTQNEFVVDGKLETPFASLPGMMTASCESTATHDYLAVTINADPDDNRTDNIVGDVVINGEVAADWGLHMVDMNLTIGNLVKIVGQQAEAWTTDE